MRKRGFLLAPLTGVITGVYVFTVTGSAFAQVVVAPPPPVPITGTVHVNVQAGGGAPAAPPATSGDDTVYLRDGGMIRGTIMEVIPGNHVTVQLANGQIATIRWDVIDRIDRHSQAAPPTVVNNPTPVTTVPAITGNATVHMEGNEDVVLEQLSGGGNWRQVCGPPCDRPLPLDPLYRITGPGTRPSKPFQLQADNGQRVVLDVHRASSGGFAGGIVLISLGSAATFVGLIVMLVGAAEQDLGAGGGTLATGFIITGVGVASLVVGIVLTVANKHSSVAQSIAANADLTGPKVARLLGTPERRAPAWFDGVNHTADSTPASPVVPIFSHAF